MGISLFIFDLDVELESLRCRSLPALPVLPYGLHYPYALGHPLTYGVAPVQYKYVPKEYEVPVKTIEFVAPETGCTNVNGNPVPCRAKRDAEEGDAAPVVPAIFPGFYHHPYAYPYAAAPVTYKIPEPVVHEIEVPTPVIKKVVEKVPLLPA